MAIVWVKEVWSGRRGRRTNAGVREYTRVFKVRVNNLQDGPKRIRNAEGLPKIGDSYQGADIETDVSALCNSVAPEQTDDPEIWQVVCDYSTRPSTSDPSQNAGSDAAASGGEGGEGGSGDSVYDPVLRFPTWAWNSVFRSEVVKTVDGCPLANSAGQPYTPPPEWDMPRPILSITKNEALWSPSEITTYRGTRNSTAWVIADTTIDPFRARYITSNARQKWEGLISYYEVTREFEINDVDWVYSLLDYGRFESDTINQANLGGVSPGQLMASGKPALTVFRDAADGAILAGEHLLDGFGQMLQKDQNGKLLPAVYRDFAVFFELDYNQLITF